MDNDDVKYCIGYVCEMGEGGKTHKKTIRIRIIIDWCKEIFYDIILPILVPKISTSVSLG